VTCSLVHLLLPEVVLTVAACALFFVGAMSKGVARRAAPSIALGGLIAALIALIFFSPSPTDSPTLVVSDSTGSVRLTQLSTFIKTLAGLVGVVLLLLAWPTDPDGRSSRSLHLGEDGGEFFGLALLSICGVMLVAGANDIILLFLALELVSIPTYVMVSISRPLPQSQEAGVKYFFLGAMAAALMLFGLSYLYGTTGSTKLTAITSVFQAPGATLTPWQLLGIVVLVGALAFKIAAVPLHFYVGDVYEGAATPVTAFLAFVPKTAGFVALVKVLGAVGGLQMRFGPELSGLLWVLAVATMSVGNVLALLQRNVKRVLAYSSVAHSGYMLVGLAVLTGAGALDVRREALVGLLFYLAAYGIMNAGAFGVLMMLPAKPRIWGEAPPPYTTAETYDDLVGQGRRHPGLGLLMAIACFSLIGLPLTVGFMGKLFLIAPALKAGSEAMTWLAILTLVNAAISAAYYLRIVGAMFLRDEVGEAQAPSEPSTKPVPLLAAVVLSGAATLLLGMPPGTNLLANTSTMSATIDTARIEPILTTRPAK
jgi:NADH-quinone oxidoreductase subunit N